MGTTGTSGTDPARPTQVEQPRNVCVVGAGYVGLTAAAGLAELGHTVRCVESDPGRLATLAEGGIPIHEPGLGELVAKHLSSGVLLFTGDIEAAMEGTELALLCVGTPPRPDGDPDLRQLGRAASQAAAAATRDVVLVVKSTVPPGSCEALELLAAGHARPDVRVSVASNPEFLREGQAMRDFFFPDRVVVGVDDPALEPVVAGLYPKEWPLLFCDRRSAELVKYASNTFLALKISFANEVAALAEALGADHEKVLTGVGLDWRIGGAFLKPGPGFGGSCLPKDLSGFIAVAGSMGQPATLARAVREVNDVSRANLVAKLEAALGPLPGKRVGVLGLAFKAGTDDVRHSPALALVEDLVALGATVRAHDPVARVPGLGDAQVDDPYEAASGADALVVATAWPEYGELDSGRLQRCMEGHVVVDAVNLLDAASFGARGLDVYGVGGGHAMSVAPVLWRPLEWMIEAQPTVALDEACPDDVDALAGR